MFFIVSSLATIWLFQSEPHRPASHLTKKMMVDHHTHFSFFFWWWWWWSADRFRDSFSYQGYFIWRCSSTFDKQWHNLIYFPCDTCSNICTCQLFQSVRRQAVQPLLRKPGLPGIVKYNNIFSQQTTGSLHLRQWNWSQFYHFFSRIFQESYTNTFVVLIDFSTIY